MKISNRPNTTKKSGIINNCSEITVKPKWNSYLTDENVYKLSFTE